MTELMNLDTHIMQSPDLDAVERLMVLRREIEANDARRAFQRDFAKLQSVLPAIQKSGKASFETKRGGRMQYSYVKIDDLISALKPMLHQYGFSFFFRQKEHYDKIAVSCIVMHVEGHRENTDMTAPIDTSGNKNPIQSISSTVSYLKRITFTSAFGLSTVDSQTSSKAPVQNAYYADYAFKTNFPIWKLKIRNGSKTPQQILSLLKQKGVFLTDEQKSQVLKCGE